MGAMSDEIPNISPSDTAELMDRLRPGATYPAAVMWMEYVRLMEEKGRLLATQNALGRALTAGGATRIRVRRRVAGKPTEVHAWTLPGPEDSEAQRDRVFATMADLGQGEHPNTVIFQRYVDLSRINGWRGLLGEAQFARLLTAMGYVRVIKRGVPCRIVVKTERTIRGA